MNNSQSEREDFSLDALRSGNQNEFARLVDRYSPKIYWLALKILNNDLDAEDVLQETFLKAYKALPGFEGRSSLSTWLYRIASNEAFMVLRKRTPEIEPGSEDPEETIDNVIETITAKDWSYTPEKEMLTKEIRGMLDEAIQLLSPPLRAVFLLRDVEGLSIHETADILNISEAAVKTRLLRARLKMQQKLSDYFSLQHGEEARYDGTH